MRHCQPGCLCITPLEVFQVSAAVRFRMETGFTVVAAQDGVLRDAGLLVPGFSWHDSPPCEQICHWNWWHQYLGATWKLQCYISENWDLPRSHSGCVRGERYDEGCAE